MAPELKKLDRWYTCVNGHAFAVGECGKNMVTSPCLECGRIVGGKDHVSMNGTSLAKDLNEEVRGLKMEGR